SATSSWTSAADTSAGGTPYKRFPGSSQAPRHEEGLEPPQRGPQLVALDGAGGIDVLRAGPGTFAHKGAGPDPLVPGEDRQPLPGPLVARVEVVALGDGDGGRPDEVRVQAVDRAGGVAQHAVDA